MTRLAQQRRQLAKFGPVGAVAIHPDSMAFKKALVSESLRGTNEMLSQNVTEFSGIRLVVCSVKGYGINALHITEQILK